jgi:hypothetical protein
MHPITKKIINLVHLALIVGGLVSYNFMSAQWQVPTATAPNNNTEAPINVSTNYQAKLGDLGAVRMRAGEYCNAAGTVCFTADSINATASSTPPTCVNRTGASSVSCLATEVAVGGGCLDYCGTSGGGNCSAKSIISSLPTANGWSCVTTNLTQTTVRCCVF